MEALIAAVALAILYAIWEGRPVSIGLNIGPKQPDDAAQAGKSDHHEGTSRLRLPFRRRH